MNPQQLAADHVRGFNASVAAGDFSPVVDSLSDDATMAFDRMPVGPIAGKAAIAEAYRQSPPDATIEVIEVRQTCPASAVVAIRSGEDRRADAAHLAADGRLRALEIRLP